MSTTVTPVTPAAATRDAQDVQDVQIRGQNVTAAAKQVHAAACETVRRQRASAGANVLQLETRIRECEEGVAKLVHRWQIRERNDKMRQLCRLRADLQHALSRTPQLVVEEAAASTLKQLARLEKMRRASLAATPASTTTTTTTPAPSSVTLFTASNSAAASHCAESVGCLTHLDRRRRRTPRVDRQSVDPNAAAGSAVIALREDIVVQNFLSLFRNCGDNNNNDGDKHENDNNDGNNASGKNNDDGSGTGKHRNNDADNSPRSKLADSEICHPHLYCLPDNVCASCGARTDMNETSCMRVCTACFREQSVEAPAVAGVQSKSDWARRQTYMVDHAHRLLGMTHNLPDERANVEAVRRELLRLDNSADCSKVTLPEVERAMTAVGLGKLILNSKHFVMRELRNVPLPTPEQFQMFVAMFSCLNSKFVELRATGVIKRLNMTSYPRNAYRLVSMMSWGEKYLPIMGKPATVSETHEQLWRQICAHVPQFRQAPQHKRCKLEHAC